MTDYVNKKFKVVFPLAKGYDGDDGYYYLDFALSTTDVDLEREQVTPECLDDMIQQAKSLNSFQCHQYGLNDIIGPIVDSWKETTDKAEQMIIKVRVRPSLKDMIKELIDTGVYLGGSFGGLYVKDHMEKGIRKLDQVKLLEGSLTGLPANWATLGTAEEGAAPQQKSKCPGGICKQIFKSLHKKYQSNELEDDKVVENNSADEGTVKTVPDDSIEDKSDKSLEDDMMDEETIQKITEANKAAYKEANKELLDGFKEIMNPAPEEPEGGGEPSPAVDTDAIVKQAKDEIFKALGIEISEEEPETVAKTQELDAEGFVKTVKDQVIKELTANRAPQRKSARIGSPDKFGEESLEEKKEGGKVSTTKAAEMIAKKKGLIPSA